jgi:hypothetical protein
VVAIEWKKSLLSRKVVVVEREEAVINVPWGRHCAPHRRDLGEDAREASRRGRRSRTLRFGWPTTPPPVRARRRRRRASLALSSVRARRRHATPWRQSWPLPPSETRPPPAADCLRLHEREREKEDAQTKDEVTPRTRVNTRR